MTSDTRIDLAISAEGLFGLTWPLWKRLVPAVESLGFSGLYLSDHFLLNDTPDYPSLELITALTYLAGATERLRFGSMVAPLSMRDPVMLARQAAALDDLSEGRMVLGLGAGWAENEHVMYGYPLGDIATRFARLDEGLQVITGLLRADDPVTFSGRFYQVRDAVLPGPGRPGGPPILIGGSGPRRTLPLVARHADIWNAQELRPDGVRERSALLDRLLVAAGRQPADVRRTLNTWVICWRTPDELADRLRWYMRYAGFAGRTAEDVLAELRDDWYAITGTPEEVTAQIEAYAAAGITQLSIQWPGLDDIEGLTVLASDVLPAFTA